MKKNTLAMPCLKKKNTVISTSELENHEKHCLGTWVSRYIISRKLLGEKFGRVKYF